MVYRYNYVVQFRVVFTGQKFSYVNAMLTMWIELFNAWGLDWTSMYLHEFGSRALHVQQKYIDEHIQGFKEYAQTFT